MKKPVVTSLLIASMGGLFSACDSSLSDTAGQSGATGTTGTRYVQGIITGFGSVYVNGVKFETDSAEFIVDDNPATQADLAVGMKISLEGTINADGTTGTAGAIHYSDEVEGIVESISIASDGTGTMVVMGQSVIIDANTIFESNVSTIGDITLVANGNMVEVSGDSAGTGTIYASRMELKAESWQAGDEVELKGLISGLGSDSFNIGTLAIAYNADTLIDVQGGILDGLYVEVKSTLGFDDLGRLIATKIELEGDGEAGIDAAAGDEVELQGVVSELLTDGFVLGGQSVAVDDNTEYEDGLTGLVDISVEVRLEIEGVMDENGRLLANQIKKQELSQADIELKGVIETVDATSSSLILLGQHYVLDNNTMMEDESELKLASFSINDLVAGDFVELRAYRDENSGEYHLARLKRKSESVVAGEFELEGKVESIDTNANQFFISGIGFDLSGFPTATVDQELEISGNYLEGVFSNLSISVDI